MGFMGPGGRVYGPKVLFFGLNYFLWAQFQFVRSMDPDCRVYGPRL